VWGIRGGPSAATTFGNVMHNTIRQFIAAMRKGLRFSFDEVVTTFRREWTSAGFEDRHQEELYLGDGIEQLRTFHASCLTAAANVVGQERRFTIHCENGVDLTGRMDQINRIAPGEVEIIDYKTGKPKSEAHAAKDLQLSVYALAAREVLDVTPVRLIYYNLQTNECVSASRDAKQLQEVRGTIQEVAGDIRAREFPARPGFVCKNCEFRFVCPAHESGLARSATLDSAEREAIRSSLHE
jgi:DNA helicase-2/ATP-dependent DNA helicase PcrA